MLVQDEPLPAANRARDLVAESNHRIANTLAIVSGLVRVQGSRLDNGGGMLTAQEVREVLSEVASRIDTAGRLHRFLAAKRDDGPLDLGPYLREIAEGLVCSLSSPGRVSLRFQTEQVCRVAAERALSVGLLVGELVTNSIKYAHPSGIAGRIVVACGPSAGGGITVEVEDDGVGLPEDFDPGAPGHLGMDIIHGLARQAGGKVAFHSDGLGLRCVLHLTPSPKPALRTVHG